MFDSLGIYVNDLENLIVLFGTRILIAIFFLIMGLYLVNKSRDWLMKMMEKKQMDESLRPFLLSIYSIVLKIALVLSVISIVGIETTSFIAVLGSAGLAVGLALQGSLSNFAGGVLILTLKPFRKGDFIEVNGKTGTVFMINIFNTVLKTPDNQTIYMPNGPLANSAITNFTEEPHRRLVINFSISYDDSIPKAKSVIEEMILADERVLQEPAPQIVVTSWADSAIVITARVWAKKEDFWALNFYLNEAVKLRFDEEGIKIPFPQRDIHVYQH
jgi:small conductance mechanosensitive channel